MPDVLVKNATGVIKAIRMMPPNQGEDGDQHKWKNPEGGMLYYYIMTFRDDDGTVYEGEVGAKTPYNYSIPVGSTITTEIYRNGEHIKFKKAKVVQKADQPKTAYNNPENNMKMAYSMARTHTIAMYKNLMKRPSSPEAFYNIVNLFFNWITEDKTLTDRDKLSRRWYILQDAVACIELWDLADTTAIIEQANEFVRREQDA